MQKTSRKRLKQTDKKTLINGDKEKRRIQGKLNNNNEHLWFDLLKKKLHFTTQKHSGKR